MKLLKLQEQLETDYDHSFVGQTVSETISTLLSMAQKNRANKVKDEFKVPEKRFWWIKLQAYVGRRDWDELLKFARSKQAPMGYDPFYYQCFKAGSKRQAAQYISMCTNLTYQKRIQMCIQVDSIRQAAQEAVKAKDIDALKELEPLATTTVKSEISDFMTQLQSKK